MLPAEPRFVNEAQLTNRAGLWRPHHACVCLCARLNLHKAITHTDMYAQTHTHTSVVHLHVSTVCCVVSIRRTRALHQMATLQRSVGGKSLETLHSACRSGHADDDHWEIKTILKLFWGNWSLLLLSVKLTHHGFFFSVLRFFKEKKSGAMGSSN